MSLPRIAPASLALFALAAVPSVAAAASPVRVIEASIEVPDGMEPDAALATVDDVAGIFDRYEPVLPKVPGVRMELEKRVVSLSGPTVVELPVEGSAFGKDILEQARVTATALPVSCDGEVEGRAITLDFTASSYNIERRIDRIEIVACPRTTSDGRLELHAVGSMYAGFLPEDPERNALTESIGARALQSAFLKQVPAVFTAVESHWSDQLLVVEPG